MAGLFDTQLIDKMIDGQPGFSRDRLGDRVPRGLRVAKHPRVRSMTLRLGSVLVDAVRCQ